jgi:hypothetical protein
MIDPTRAEKQEEQAHCDPDDPADDHHGDCRDHVAIDPESRSVVAMGETRYHIYFFPKPAVQMSRQMIFASPRMVRLRGLDAPDFSALGRFASDGRSPIGRGSVIETRRSG